MEMIEKQDIREGKTENLERNTTNKKRVYFVCAHGLGISGSFAMAMQDYLDKHEILDYELFQRGYQIPSHLEEIREEDSVFVARPFREEVEALRSKGKLTSRRVHYVEMPWRPYASECNLRDEFASGILQILGGKDAAAIVQ